jgi:uroporphyrinogen III methyltransferase / synthase
MAVQRPPLAGVRILVTRPSEGAGGLSDQLSAAGAEVYSVPLTRIEPGDPGPLRASLARLSDYDWLLLTSLNGVAIVFDELDRLESARDELSRLKLAVVGAATAAAVRARGIEPAVVPLSFNAEELLAALLDAEDMRGKRVLYAVAQGARDVIPVGLEAAGARVETVHLYRSIRDQGAAERARRLMDAAAVDLVVFTSGSGVHAFVAAVGGAKAASVRAASIGPATSSVVRSYGIDVVVEARESTIPGLVQAIVDSYIAPDE